MIFNIYNVYSNTSYKLLLIRIIKLFYLSYKYSYLLFFTLKLTMTFFKLREYMTLEKFKSKNHHKYTFDRQIFDDCELI
jgi:hypothetical protein